MARKLGCNFDPNHPLIAKLPRFSQHLSIGLTPASYSDWSTMVTIPWGMLANGPDPLNPPEIPEGIGDCVVAGAYHQRMVWLAAASNPVTFTSQQVIADYSSITGYVLGDDSTDNGTDPMELIKVWGTRGIASGHTIDASAIIETWDNARISIDINAGVLLCLNFPAGWEDAKTWDVSTAGSQIAGGHLVYGVAQDSGAFQIITWGEQRTLAKDGWDKFCTLSIGCMSKDFIGSDQGTPDAMAYSDLIASMPSLG